MNGAGRAGADAVSSRLIRSIRFWMHAYPARWRAVRGEELLGVVADLTAPGAERLRAREALDLARAGWATRWRERPPLRPWLAYRLLDRTIPTHRAWMQDDILSVGWPARNQTPLVLIMMVVGSGGRRPEFWFGVVFLVALVVPSGYQRHRALRRHVALRPGEQLYCGALVVQDAPRRRVEARPALARLLGAAVPLAVASAPVMALAPLGVWGRPIPAGFETGVGPVAYRGPALVIAVAAVILGLVWAAVAHRRLARILDTPVVQPYRLVHRVTLHGSVRVVASTALGIWLLGLEVTGRLAMGLSVVVWTGAMVTVPVATVALLAVRARSRPTAAVDVWRVAVLGRPPVVDGPVAALLPLVGSVPEGAVVPPPRLGDPARVALP